MTVTDDRITEEFRMPRDYHKDLELLADAFELMVELWPVPENNTVTLKPEQWKKLRMVILSIPDLVGEIHEGAFGSIDNLSPDRVRAAFRTVQGEGNGHRTATDGVPL